MMPKERLLLVRTLQPPPMVRCNAFTSEVFMFYYFFIKDVKGHFEMVIKAYPDGVVSSYLHSLKVQAVGN